MSGCSKCGTLKTARSSAGKEIWYRNPDNASKLICSKCHSTLILAKRDYIAPCTQTGKRRITRACKCPSCVQRRAIDYQWHKDYHARHPERTKVMKQQIMRRYDDKKKATDPQGFSLYNRWQGQRYRRLNHDKFKNSVAMQIAKKRHLILVHYGGNPPRCACCGEMQHEFLAIDHINGGGKKHRGKLVSLQYYNLIMRTWPEDLRILCHNCNSSLGFYGYCPHNLKKGSPKKGRERLFAKATLFDFIQQ